MDHFLVLKKCHRDDDLGHWVCHFSHWHTFLTINILPNYKPFLSYRYKNAPAPREGFLLRKRLSDASASANRWSGLNSKTTSLGSLGANAQPPPPQLSPHTTSFGRWSTSRLNSNQVSFLLAIFFLIEIKSTSIQNNKNTF